MPEGAETTDVALIADLRDYLVTLAEAPMPQRVRVMSSTSLAERRRRQAPRRWAVATGALATVAVVTTVALHLSGLSAQNQAGTSLHVDFGPPLAGPASQAGTVAYPGVDPMALAAAGRTRLLSPAGHGAALVGPDVARQTAAGATTAAAAPGSPAGTPVLAWVEDRSAAPITCLCWVVGERAGGAAPVPAGHVLLVYVDAVTGLVAGTHSGAGT